MIRTTIDAAKVQAAFTPAIGVTDSPWGLYAYPSRAEVERISAILTPVVKAIFGEWKEDLGFEVDLYHDDLWTFYSDPFTILDPDAYTSEEEEARYRWALEFEISEPYTVWGWWDSISDGVGGEFVTTKSGVLYVFFC